MGWINSCVADVSGGFRRGGGRPPFLSKVIVNIWPKSFNLKISH